MVSIKELAIEYTKLTGESPVFRNKEELIALLVETREAYYHPKKQYNEQQGEGFKSHKIKEKQSSTGRQRILLIALVIGTFRHMSTAKEIGLHIIIILFLLGRRAYRLLTR